MMGRCLCGEKKEERKDITEALGNLIRQRRTVIALLRQEVADQERLAHECRHNEKMARTHLENKRRALADIAHEEARCKNAVGMKRALEQAHMNRELATLFREGAENLEQLASDAPNVADVIDRIRDQVASVGETNEELGRPLMEEEVAEEEEEVELPSVPTFSRESTPRTASRVPLLL